MAVGRPRVPIEVGSRLGKWTILEELPDKMCDLSGRVKAVRIVKVRCDCGFEDTRQYHTLYQGLQKYPERACRKCHSTQQVIDLTGQRFGKLQVVGFSHVGPIDHAAHWKCLCDCGKACIMWSNSLRTNGTMSCGCLRELRGQDSPKWRGHGQLSSSQWSKIRKSAEFRDIPFDLTIGQAWNLFVAQGGRCALTGLPIELRKYGSESHTSSLDRINSDRGYVLDNVQWVHARVNLAKRDTMQDDFIEMCRAVAAYNPAP